MSVRFDEKNKVFHLDTPNSSYIFGLFKNRFLVHMHYGKKVTGNFAVEDAYRYVHRGYRLMTECNGEFYSEETMPLEYPCRGGSDTREPAFCAEYEDGVRITEPLFKGYKITKGKPKLAGLPAAYVEDESEADTLEIELEDAEAGTKIFLMYTVYNTCDIITRSVKVVNSGSKKTAVSKIMSMSIDFFDSKFDFIHLHGAWARERNIQRVSLMNGIQKVDSKRGASSHQHNPFFALASKNADEFSGDVYGFGLVYSGNFSAGTEVNHDGSLRAYMGINDYDFKWTLNPGEEFQAPEVVMSYSDSGFNKMSQQFHYLVRKRICRGKFRDTARPILINNWEATYFDFNEEKIINIAKTAKELGVELMVLDDGWFGKRDSDNCSLGDWYADKNKLPGGIESLAEKINNLGMKFGLWFEPEMISPDSDLYRSHPDWALHQADRKQTLGRHQLTLDLSRDDVCEYIIGFMTDILTKAPISYVKWDMNRSMSDAGSSLLPPELQQETAHRYMLGLYRILETLTNDFPDVLFEGCAGGGGRFDLGMFYYYPQFWTSDDTDAVERMYIQYGTSMLYPTSVMGAHVSAVPNHQVSRTTSIETRGNVAMLGRFGYELDLAKLTDEEKEAVRTQIKFYKKWGQVIHTADLYRLESPFESNHMAMEFVSEDKKYVILMYTSVMGNPNFELDKVCLKGIEPDAEYRNIQTGKTYKGDLLSNIGITMQNEGDITSEYVIFEKI